MTKRSFAPAAALLAVLAWPAAAGAQDAHYWTYGYGPVGQLTEGTLVGGVNDLSAVFYNPGALRAHRRAAVRLQPHLDRARQHRRPRRGGRGPRLRPAASSTSSPRWSPATSAEPRQDVDHFAFAFLARHDSDWDLGYSDARVVRGHARRLRRASAASASAWSSTGSGGTWSHRSRRPRSRGCLAVRRLPRPAEPARRSRSEAWRPARRARSSSASENEYNHVARSWPRSASPGARPLGARRDGDHRGRRASGAPARRSSTPSVSGVESAPILSASRQDGLDVTYHVPVVGGGGATLALRRAPRSTPRSSGSRPSTRTTSSSRSRRPSAGGSTTIPLTFQGAAESVVNYGARRRAPPRETLVALRGRGAQPLGLRRPSGTRSPRGTSPT